MQKHEPLNLTQQRRQPVDVSLDMRIQEDDDLPRRSLRTRYPSTNQAFSLFLMNDFHLPIKMSC